ncbi:Exocyst complex component exo84 like protein [Verticillium longisporum]|nr:Exocyst complex component exo84 like protein [Verticillium longisporum]
MSSERSRISLRSGPRRKGGRPTISAPRQISEPIPQNGPSPLRNANGPASGPALRPINEAAPPPQQRQRPPIQPGGGNATSDLVKRRYSTRFGNFAEAGFDVNNPPVPALPTLDKYESREKRGGPPPSRGGAAPAIDLKALRDPNLNADQYVAGLLSDATEDQIQEYQDSLRQLKARAQADLQQNVMQNRTQFIKIAHEADKLKDEMRTLRNLMAELKANTTSLRAAAGGRNESTSLNGELSTGLSKRDKRSSVADRSALWNSQMQALYKNVEGTQKFLPNAPGRHVIQNAGQWIELDNATYKSRRATQIFLLNDHLLIASRKKRKTDGPPREGQGNIIKLVADRCWPLLDVEVFDMAGSSESSSTRSKLTDAIRVRGNGQESFIYRTEKPDDPDKPSLLLNIRKAVEELRKSLQSEMEANNKTKETINYFASRDPGLLQKAELLETLSDIKDMRIEVDGNQQNLRWVEGQMDELDIEIALQHFENAVERVEKLKKLARGLKSNAVAQNFINFKVEERCVKVADMLLRELDMYHNMATKTRHNVIQHRSRQCTFQGDLHQYIWEISFCYFTLIKHTVTVYQSCFPPPMMSTCVKWAKEEVEAFNLILSRQLSSTERDGKVWSECMDRAQKHASMLAEVGLDFKTMVGQELREFKRLDEQDWEAVLFLPDRQLEVSTTVKIRSRYHQRSQSHRFLAAMPYNTTAIPPRKEVTGQPALPLARVRKIIAQDPDISICSSNAAFIITVATEMFIQHLANEAHNQAKLDRKPRRNVQYKDLVAGSRKLLGLQINGFFVFEVSAAGRCRNSLFSLLLQLGSIPQKSTAVSLRVSRGDLFVYNRVKANTELVIANERILNKPDALESSRQAFLEDKKCAKVPTW